MDQQRQIDILSGTCNSLAKRLAQLERENKQLAGRQEELAATQLRMMQGHGKFVTAVVDEIVLIHERLKAVLAKVFPGLPHGFAEIERVLRIRPTDCDPAKDKPSGEG